jgi:hypothetical protein
MKIRNNASSRPVNSVADVKAGLARRIVISAVLISIPPKDDEKKLRNRTLPCHAQQAPADDHIQVRIRSQATVLCSKPSQDASEKRTGPARVER